MKREFLPILIQLEVLEADTFKMATSKSAKRPTKSKIKKRDHTMYQTKLKEMTEKLVTKEMKAIFVGPGSCGKTTVIDALIGSTVIPCELGDSTNCFISVKSCRNQLKPYVSVSGSDERQKIERLKDVMNSCSDSNQMVDIVMPMSCSPILDFPVTIIDSPGIDFNKKMDREAKEYYEKATVLVIVQNYDSSLSDKEKKFYRKIKSRMVAPSLFIVFNLFDPSSVSFNSLEERMKQYESAKQFLTEDLCCVSKDDAANRIFFISGMEALQYNSSGAKEFVPSPKPVGYDFRKKKFGRFVAEFKKNLSNLIIASDFKPYCDESLTICASLSRELKGEVDDLSSTQDVSLNQLNDLFFKIMEMKAKLKLLGTIQDQIPLVSKKNQSVNLSIIAKEFKKLSDICDKFMTASSHSPNLIAEFQKIISDHIFNEIKVRIQQAKGYFLSSEIEKLQSECNEFFRFVPAGIKDRDKWYDLEDAINMLLVHSPFESPLFNKICPNNTFTIFPNSLSIFKWIFSRIDSSQHYFETSPDGFSQINPSDSMYRKYIDFLNRSEFFENNNSIVPATASAVVSEISRFFMSKYTLDNVTPDSLLGNMMQWNDDQRRSEAFFKQMLNYAEEKLIGIFDEICTQNTQMINNAINSMHDDLNKTLLKFSKENNRLEEKIVKEKRQNYRNNLDLFNLMAHNFELYKDSMTISDEIHSFADNNHIQTIS